MRIVQLLLLLLFSSALTAQVTYRIPADSVKIYKRDSTNAELIIENATRDTSGFLFNKGNGRTEFRRALKKINDSTYLVGVDTLRLLSGSGGGATDTTSLSNRINQKVNISDTAAMLDPYLRKIDTTGKWISAGWLSSLMKYADTTAMLSPYLRKADTAAMLAPYLRSSDAIKWHLINGANNLGSGAQIFKDTSGNKINLRSLTAGWGLTANQNTNDVEYKADSNLVASKARVKHVADSLGYIISGESVAWGTYAQRVALTGLTYGQRFYQTNERVGLWVYEYGEWVHYPPVSTTRYSSMRFPGALSTSTSGSGSAAGYGTNGASFKMSGGYAYVATGTTSTGYGVAYATKTTATNTDIPADSADNGFKMVLVGKIALLAAPTSGEDFRFNFGTRNPFSTAVNDSTGYGYVFSIANYRNSSFIECYTSSRGPTTQTTTTSVPISSAVFPLVSGYPNDFTSVSEGFITFVLVYNTRRCDYYINGTLVATHTLSGTRSNDQGVNDWVLSIAKTTGTSNRFALLESVYGYIIKDNF